jgi:hypothetical protein
MNSTPRLTGPGALVAAAPGANQADLLRSGWSEPWFPRLASAPMESVAGVRCCSHETP